MNLQELISEIDRLKAEIDLLRPLDKERESRIWQKFRLDWNFHSNNIEGNSLTYGETKSFLLHGITAAGKSLKDHLDIRGHNEALLELTDLIKENRPLTEALIRQIHETILPEPYDVPAITSEGIATVKHIVPGRYKISPNHVKTVTGEIFYFASPEETPAKMHELLNWFREKKDETSFHPLILSAEFHYRFIRIHPFDDGNGRMARIFMNLILMMKGFPPVIIKTQKKEEYYRALRQADGGNIESFVNYIGEQLVASTNLYLLGAKGEDIQELDDLDKELLLLKAKIIGQKKDAINKRNSDYLNEIAIQTILPLIDIIHKKMQLVSELFSSINFPIHAETILIAPTGPAKDINELKKSVLFIIKNGQPTELSIYFLLEEFNAPQTKPFGITLHISFSFTDFDYHITYDAFNPNKTITKQYGQYLTIDEQNKIGQDYANNIKDTLKRHGVMM